MTRMGTSRYFDQTIFEESLAADQIFEEKSGDIFQTNAKESFVDVHLQSPCPDDGVVRAIDGFSHEPQQKTSLQNGSKPAMLGKYEDLTEPNTPLDKCDYRGRPPTYVAKLGLSPIRITNPVELEDILQKVGKLWRNFLSLSIVD